MFFALPFGEFTTEEAFWGKGERSLEGPSARKDLTLGDYDLDDGEPTFGLSCNLSRFMDILDLRVKM